MVRKGWREGGGRGETEGAREGGIREGEVKVMLQLIFKGKAKSGNRVFEVM